MYCTSYRPVCFLKLKKKKKKEKRKLVSSNNNIKCKFWSFLMTCSNIILLTFKS